MRQHEREQNRIIIEYVLNIKQYHNQYGIINIELTVILFSLIKDILNSISKFYYSNILVLTNINKQ